MIRRAALAVLAALAIPAGTPGQTRESVDEALARTFPEATRIGRATAVLDDDERRRIAAAADVALDETPALVTYYEAYRDGRAVGRAYFDTHVVRTHREVLMVVVRPDGSLGRIEVFRFGEPPEYRAPERWLREFEGRSDPGELTTRRAIPMIAGATLTARAATGAARRILSIHAAISRGHGGRP